MEDDDFARRVYCILGVPVDDIGMPEVVAKIHTAALTRRHLFLSTPNLNYLVLSQQNPEFRRSLLVSDLCPADGIGVVIICRMLGVPINARVAGSDLPAALQASKGLGRDGPLRIALLGGEPGVGDVARRALNAGDTSRLLCVAAIDPGVVAEDRISDPELVKRVNVTAADFLLVALGAQKGQAWITRNREKLTMPIVSHLGATLNFLAGAVRRAPVGVRKLGLEWLWRIKEEPKLAPRYLADGIGLAWMLLTRVLPLSAWLRRARSTKVVEGNGVWLSMDRPEICTVIVGGNVADAKLEPVSEAFRNAALSGLDIILDLGRLKFFGLGFAGQVLMLEKAALTQNRRLTIMSATATVCRALAWCGLRHLIGREPSI